MSIISQDRDSNTKEWIKALFHTYEAGLNGQKDMPIAAFRRTAFDQLMEERFPTRRDEDWKYTNVAPILKVAYQQGSSKQLTRSDISRFEFEELDAVRIVTINGVLDQELSDVSNLPAGMTLLPVEEALQNETFAKRIDTMISQKGGTDINAFLRMNRAFGKHGYYIQSDKNSKVERPVHFIHINTRGNDAHFSHPQMFIVGQQSGELNVIESYHTLDADAKYFTNAANYVQVEDNAHVHHYRLQYESPAAFQISNTIVTQGKDSTYSNYGVDLGGKIVRNNLSTELLNSGTMTNYYGAYLGLDSQHIDNQTFIDHAVPHCDSNELYKGILSDKARGVFNGKVLVRQDAQKTNAFQQNSSLVLSDTAVMDAKPQLEIYADDVKCSHGATIGQLDESSVFYLKSRGLPDEAAKNLLQKAFVGDVVTNFELESIKDDVLERIDAKLERK